MFYDRFSKVCKEKGTTPTSVVKAVGLSTGGMAHWKKGATPKIDTLRKLADYLKVDVNDLLDDDQKEKPVEDDGPNTLEEAREVLRQSGIRVLLDAEGDDFTPEEIKEIMNFIKFKHEQRGKQN